MQETAASLAAATEVCAGAEVASGFISTRFEKQPKGKNFLKKSFQFTPD